VICSAFISSTFLHQVSLNSNSQASITGGSVWSAGSYNVSAVYSGDNNYSAASGSTTLTIQKATPSAPSGVNSTYIYARWTGTFVSPTTGTYTIGVNSDDGANLYVNGTLLVGNLTTVQGAQGDLTYSQSGQIALTAGATNTIVVEYQQGWGGAGVQLLWTPPGASSSTLLGWTVVPVNGDAQASITGGSVWGAGSYTVSAVYSGDTNFNSASASNSLTISSNSGLSCAPSILYVGGNTTCSVNLPAGATGAVSYVIGGQTNAVASPNSFGLASGLVNLSAFGAGTLTISYSYPGDGFTPAMSGSTAVTLVANGQTLPNSSQVYQFSITNPNGSSGFAHNGNITGYFDSVNGLWSQISYDSLNRLTGAQVSPAIGGSQASNLCWTYDSFGNRTGQTLSNQPFSTGSTPCQPTAGSTYYASQFAYPNPTNQISSGQWQDQ
jgi:hypothetical protein